MRNRPDSESIDVVDLTIHAFGRIDEDRQHIHFERSLTRCKTRTLRVEITRALNRTCFHDLAGSIGATKRQPNPAMRWAYRGSSPHRLIETIVNSRSALPREQLTIRKANLYEGSARQIGTLRMPRQREHWRIGAVCLAPVPIFRHNSVTRISAFNQSS